MKRFVFAVLVVVTAAANIGSAEDCWQCGGLVGNLSGKCSKFGDRLFANRGQRSGGFGAGGAGGAGQGGYGAGGYGMAPSPTVVYPYYTVRAPRDFLSPNPRGIGP